jgi:NAD(P)-dependent dehydrogenase (short-subunit alcohol dehydrogenase family)
MQLSDQVALVTGAGQGIGKASALALAAAGANVVAVDINGESVKETAAAVAALGRRSLAVQADMGSAPDIDRMVAEAIAAFGKIDVLVNNAGVTRRAYIMDLTEEDWDRIHRVNAKGVFFCLQRVAREMIPRRSGRIINMASIAGKGFAGTSNAIYAASKGAVISLTKTAAQQLGQHNINVNAVCPGIVRTSLYLNMVAAIAQKEGVGAEEVERRYVGEVPLQRANEPEDIADMVVFLASPAARNITGQSFNVDGGLIPD